MSTTEGNCSWPEISVRHRQTLAIVDPADMCFCVPAELVAFAHTLRDNKILSLVSH